MSSKTTTDVTAPDPGSTKGPKPGERGHGLQNGERLEPWDSGFTNPYGVPYQHQEPAVDGGSVGAALSGLLSGFAGESQSAGAKTRKPQFTPDQLYLTGRINARFTPQLTFGGLMKLNKRFGVGEVTSAMRDACLANGLGAAYPYLLTILREGS